MEAKGLWRSEPFGSMTERVELPSRGGHCWWGREMASHCGNGTAAPPKLKEKPRKIQRSHLCCSPRRREGRVSRRYPYTMFITYKAQVEAP